jgi:hypothetical protein
MQGAPSGICAKLTAWSNQYDAEGGTMKWIDIRRLCMIVCLGLLPMPSLAAEADAPNQPGQSDSVDNRLNQDREIAFELSEEPLELKLFRADPQLLNQKFAAVVEVFVPSHTDRRVPDRLRELAVFQSQSLLHLGGYQVGFGGRDRPPTPADTFRRLAREVNGAAEAADEGLDFLQSDEVNEGYLSGGWLTPVQVNGANGGYYSFTILAPSEEQARERAEALIRLLDAAIAVPLQRELHRQREQQEETIDSLRKQLAETEERAKQTVEDYERIADTAVSHDELSQLKTERRLLEVELAGIRARIETAEEILAKLKELQKAAGRPADARILKVEDLKITAEIDLAGLAARRKALDLLIEEGNKRAELNMRRNEQLGQVEKLRRRLDEEERGFGGLQDVMERYSQLYSLEDDKVVVRPIQWTE